MTNPVNLLDLDLDGLAAFCEQLGDNLTRRQIATETLMTRRAETATDGAASLG